jgi:hypothetical protein
MMVATALIIFIMYILASAFEKGLESFRMLKIAGDMQEQLRTAAVVMKADLRQPHFNDPGSSRGEYLSDPGLDLRDPNWVPPDKGYFRIDFGAGSLTDATDEGVDPDDTSLLRTRRLPIIPSASDVTGLYPTLQFTVRLSGDRQDQQFSTQTTVPGLSAWSQPTYTAAMYGANVFTSKWAEVTYFVLPTTTTPTGRQLYALYRRVKLLYDDSTLGTFPPPVIAPNDPGAANLSFWRRQGSGNSRAELNTPANVTAPLRRWGNAQRPSQPNGLVGYGNTDTLLAASNAVYGPASDVAGTDLLIANLTDFEIKAQWEAPKLSDGFSSVYNTVTGPSTTSVDYPFDLISNINQNNRSHVVFDTWSKEEDDTGRGQPAYSYGRPPNPNGSGLMTGTVKGHGRYDKNNKDLARWNAGHMGANVDPNLQPWSVPIRVRVKAVQIKIRIWDVKSQQSRQITLVQDL